MVSAETIVSDFQLMHREHWQYVWGKHEKGVVDCSGAFYYAYHVLHGLPMYNGSNRIARVYTTGGLIPYKEAKQKGLIVPGMAAFKHRVPGDSGYNLGSGYKPGGANYNGDLNDYYHIGTVDQDINYVLNAQSAKTGFVRSKITENWSYVARMKNIEYGGDKPMEEKEMLVVRANETPISSKTVNVRSAPEGAVLFTVPFGSTAWVSEASGEWSKVRFNNGKTGWMMNKFLESVQSGDADILVCLDNISRELDKIYKILGRVK